MLVQLSRRLVILSAYKRSLISQYKVRKPGLAEVNLRGGIALRGSEWGVEDG